MFNVARRFTALFLLTFISGCNYKSEQAKMPAETTNPSSQISSTPDAVSSPSETSSTPEDIPLPHRFNYESWVQIRYQGRGASATYIHPGSLTIGKNSAQAWLAETNSTASGTMRQSRFTSKVEVDCTRKRIKEMFRKESVHRYDAVARPGTDQESLQKIENQAWNENEELVSFIPNICNFLDVSDNGNLPLPPRFAPEAWVHIADVAPDRVVDKNEGQYPIYTKLENAETGDRLIKAWVEFSHQQENREKANKFFLLLVNCAASEDEWKFKGLASVGDEIIVEPSQQNRIGSYWLDEEYEQYLAEATPRICKQFRSQ